MNKGILIAIVLILVLGGGYLAFGRGSTAPAPTVTNQVPAGDESADEMVDKEDGDAMEDDAMMEKAREVAVNGDEFSFSPASIRVTKGEKISLVFNNVGNFPHNFTVGELSVATKTIQGGGTDTVEFTAEKSGTFSYYCSVGNHRAQGMEGEMEVN